MQRFSKRSTKAAQGIKPRAKPLKRPSQARSRFTVEVIFEAFVQVWRQKGWDRLTTRQVALEAGFAIGTLYQYFPSKQALLSGYTRHCVEWLYDKVDVEVIKPEDLGWRDRLHRLIRLTGALNSGDGPYFDSQMVALEYQIAETRHHQRVLEELIDLWKRAFAACDDLAVKPPDAMVDSMLTNLWGGFRYGLLTQRDDAQRDAWLECVETLYASYLDHPDESTR